MSRLRNDGSCYQSGLAFDEGDYGHEEIYFPFVGIIMSVYPSDGIQNVAASKRQYRRGPHLEATVYVVNSGTDTPLFLPNVVVTPSCLSGLDNFFEVVPKGSSVAKGKKRFRTDLRNVDVNLLDGDWCVVDFIGGSIHQPFITSWWPHPQNLNDAATQNQRGAGNLVQGRRLVRRFQGSTFAVTRKGSVFVDTSNAAQLLEPDGTRKTKEIGGDVDITVKQSAQFQVNFNPPVIPNLDEPEVLQPNPPRSTTQPTRQDTLSKLVMNKNFITAVAGEVLRLASYGQIKLGEDTASENFVLGQQWKSMMETLLDAIKAITVPTGTGPSGTPINRASFEAIKNQLDDQLSDWIFGQKEAPTVDE